MNKNREQAEVEIEKLLGVIGQLQKSKSKEILNRFDCSISQFSILQVLSSNPKMQTTVVELSRILEINMSQATATRSVAALVEKKYLASEPHPRDKRQSLITITHEGLSRFKVLYRELTDVTDKTYKQWSTEELYQFKRFLSDIAELIKQR